MCSVKIFCNTAQTIYIRARTTLIIDLERKFAPK